MKIELELLDVKGKKVTKASYSVQTYKFQDGMLIMYLNDGEIEAIPVHRIHRLRITSNGQ